MPVLLALKLSPRTTHPARGRRHKRHIDLHDLCQKYPARGRSTPRRPPCGARRRRFTKNAAFLGHKLCFLKNKLRDKFFVFNQASIRCPCSDKKVYIALYILEYVCVYRPIYIEDVPTIQCVVTDAALAVIGRALDTLSSDSPIRVPPPAWNRDYFTGREVYPSYWSTRSAKSCL